MYMKKGRVAPPFSFINHLFCNRWLKGFSYWLFAYFARHAATDDLVGVPSYCWLVYGHLLLYRCQASINALALGHSHSLGHTLNSRNLFDPDLFAVGYGDILAACLQAAIDTHAYSPFFDLDLVNKAGANLVACSVDNSADDSVSPEGDAWDQQTQ